MATRRVLVVDDEAEVRKALAGILRAMRYPDALEIEEVADGQAGLDAVIRQRPDLILLDLHMPRMSGLTLLEHIRDVDARADHRGLRHRGQQGRGGGAAARRGRLPAGAVRSAPRGDARRHVLRLREAPREQAERVPLNTRGPAHLLRAQGDKSVSTPGRRPPRRTANSAQLAGSPIPANFRGTMEAPRAGPELAPSAPWYGKQTGARGGRPDAGARAGRGGARRRWPRGGDGPRRRRRAAASGRTSRLRPDRERSQDARPRRAEPLSRADPPLAGHPATPAVHLGLRGVARVRGFPAGDPRAGAAQALRGGRPLPRGRSEEHTSELQSRRDLVCRLLLEKKKK